MPPSLGSASIKHGISKVPHVAIVGAGMAGLRCANVLARSGIKVTVFEARNRIGGRVHQIQSGGHLMDMGPNWIHGTKGNPIMELAHKTNTTVISPDEDGALFDTQGRRRPDTQATQLSATIWGMVIDAFKHSDEHTDTIDPNTSLYDHFRTVLAKQSLPKDEEYDLLRESEMWGPFVGDPIQTQSLKFFWLEECIEGENVFVASTYKDILKSVGDQVVSHDLVDLHLDSEVVRIKRFDMVETGDTAVKKQVQVTISDGCVQDFDHVVVTCPLGWLKQHIESVFSPPLPTRLCQAIDHINYGRLEKLYITFPRAFWLGLPSTDSTASTTINTNYPLFTHFQDPDYIAHPADQPWNQSVVSLANLPSPHSHPTLLFYMYGPCATHLVSQIKNHPEDSHQYREILDTFAHPFYSRLPHYSDTDSACHPASFLITQWQNDKFAGHGSYSNFQVGLERGDEDIEVMRDAGGLTDQGIWFAGEHTAPFIAIGTTTGAYWSGAAVARRICSSYGILMNEAGDALENIGLEKKKGLEDGKADAANLDGLAI
ncbi:hypothetical protein B0A52_04716 [Exophiala mesophila]|uniref:Amine oxidase domain-containing protein n=1 Tax=Exophiala mesophila TaxID=212818 RepID=A0A438N963_EXOME|nr:hypothetical protein B0A52_04716 [Exophiala mesophila]